MTEPFLELASRETPPGLGSRLRYHDMFGQDDPREQKRLPELVRPPALRLSLSNLIHVSKLRRDKFIRDLVVFLVSRGVGLVYISPLVLST